MAVDMFLKIDKIPGECQKKGHVDEIDILSFSCGMNQTGAFHNAGLGGGSGKAEISDLHIEKLLDKASPLIYTALTKGTHIKDVTVVCQKASGDNTTPLVYYTLKLEDVMVSNVQTHGASSGNSVGESVSFNTAKMTFDYQPQDAKGAKLGGVVTSSYDIRQNVNA